jgi:hypothetical protein
MARRKKKSPSRKSTTQFFDCERDAEPPSPKKAAKNINQRRAKESTRESWAEFGEGAVADRDVRDDSRQMAVLRLGKIGNGRTANVLRG